MKFKLEMRQFPQAVKIENENVPDEERGRKPLHVVGYASVFNTLSLDLGGFFEIVKPGAFLDSINNGDDIRALINHNRDRIIGRTKAGTLQLKEDSKGLLTEIYPPDTTDGRDVMANLRAGNWDQMSFAFSVLPDGQIWRLDENDRLIREITKAKLHDVSVVTYPAYNESTVGLRAATGFDIYDSDEILKAGRSAVGLYTPLRDERAAVCRLAERALSAE